MCFWLRHMFSVCPIRFLVRFPRTTIFVSWGAILKLFKSFYFIQDLPPVPSSRKEPCRDCVLPAYQKTCQPVKYPDSRLVGMSDNQSERRYGSVRHRNFSKLNLFLFDWFKRKGYFWARLSSHLFLCALWLSHEFPASACMFSLLFCKNPEQQWYEPSDWCGDHGV